MKHSYNQLIYCLLYDKVFDRYVNHWERLSDRYGIIAFRLFIGHNFINPFPVGTRGNTNYFPMICYWISDLLLDNLQIKFNEICSALTWKLTALS